EKNRKWQIASDRFGLSPDYRRLPCWLVVRRISCERARQGTAGRVSRQRAGIFLVRGPACARRYGAARRRRGRGRRTEDGNEGSGTFLALFSLIYFDLP